MQDLLLGPETPPEVASPLLVGDKAHQVYRIAAAGLPVSPSWTLSAVAYDRALGALGLAGDVAEIGWNLTGLWNDWSAARRVLDALEGKRLHVARTLRRMELEGWLGRVLEKLTGMDTRWAVRASPVMAEGDGVAFPTARFLSLACVPPAAPVWEAICQVWASAWRREVLEACAQADVGLPRMAVLLQPMAAVTVQDRAGVAFSHSPIERLPGPLVQAVFGAWWREVRVGYGTLYSRVLGRWVAVNSLEERIAPQEAWVAGPNGGLVRHGPYPDGEPLAGDEAASVADLARAVAEAWGGPVAVEFAWPQGGELSVVQAYRMGRYMSDNSNWRAG